MQYRHLLIPALFAALTATAADNGKNLPSKLTSAKIFLQGAQLTRTASTSLPAGASTLVFTGLSQNMDPQSIQVTGKGGYTILSVNQRMNYLSESPKKKELDELEARMKKMDRDIANENAMLAVWNNEEQLLIKNSSVGGQQNGVTLSQLTAVNDYIRERLRAVKAGQLAQQQKLADMQEDKVKLQLQIAQLQALGQRPTSEVVVEINSPAATSASFTLNYFVGQATWTPAYDLRASGTGKPIDLLMKAAVTNNTGEDWDQVELSLSSGNPTLGGVMPALQPWTLFTWRPVQDGNARYEAAPSMAKKSEAVSEMAGMADALRGPVVNVSEQATTVEYAIATPFSVPSDGQPHTIAVQEHRLPATYTYIATPKLDKDAFLYARTTGWEDLNLLSGEANVFFEGTYVGKSQLNLSVPKDTLEISLGRDKGVVVERVKRKSTNEKSVIGGKRTVTIGWDITVRNTKGTAIELELRDQYPLSPQSEIEVKLTEEGDAAVDKNTGLFTWKLNLAPKETKKLGFAYSVKYPKDLPVVLE
ncbi:MAG: DUF4139 domain-containing protein [Bacteroidetes bacterium]|nr:DUF4139 domain-containing protein [Bacteroidota bacterium]